MTAPITFVLETGQQYGVPNGRPDGRHVRADNADEIVFGDTRSGELMFGDDPEGLPKTSGTSDELVNSLTRFERTEKIIVGDDTAVISRVERSALFVIAGAGCGDDR